MDKTIALVVTRAHHIDGVYRAIGDILEVAPIEAVKALTRGGVRLASAAQKAAPRRTRTYRRKDLVATDGDRG